MLYFNDNNSNLIILHDLIYLQLNKITPEVNNFTKNIIILQKGNHIKNKKMA